MAVFFFFTQKWICTACITNTKWFICTCGLDGYFWSGQCNKVLYIQQMLLSSSHNTFMIGLHLSQSLTCAAAPGVECCSVGLILHTQEAHTGRLQWQFKGRHQVEQTSGCAFLCWGLLKPELTKILYGSPRFFGRFNAIFVSRTSTWSPFFLTSFWVRVPYFSSPFSSF